MEAEAIQALIESTVNSMLSGKTISIKHDILKSIQDSVTDTIMNQVLVAKDDIEIQFENKMKQVESSLSRLEHKAAENTDMKDSVRILTQMMERKPDMAYVDSIRKQMGDMATQRGLQELTDVVQTKAPQIAIEQLVSNNKFVIKSLLEQSSSLDTRLTTIENKVIEQVDNHTKIFNGFKSEINELSFQTSEQNRLLKKELAMSQQASQRLQSTLAEFSDTITIKLSTYATLLDLGNVEQELLKYATLADQNAMEDRVVPLIKVCERDLIKYSRDNEEMQTAVLTYDQVISTKADRFNIIEVKVWVTQEFISQKANINNMQRIQQIELEIEDNLLQNQARIVGMEKELESRVMEIVSADLAKRMKRYEQVTADFARFFNQEMLSNILEAKVDVCQMEKMNSQKISRKEFEHFVGVQELLDRKLKLISLIQVEISKSMIPQSTNTISQYNALENANAKLLKQEILHRQAHLTYKWIQDAVVGTQSNPDIPMPQSLFGTTTNMSPDFLNQFNQTAERPGGQRDPSPELSHQHKPSIQQTPYLNQRLLYSNARSNRIEKPMRNSHKQMNSQSIDLYENPKLANESERSLRAQRGVLRSKSLAQNQKPLNNLAFQNLVGELPHTQDLLQPRNFRKNDSQQRVRYTQQDEIDPYQDMSDAPLVVLQMKANYTAPQSQFNVTVDGFSSADEGTRFPNKLQQTKYLVSHNSQSMDRSKFLSQDQH